MSSIHEAFELTYANYLVVPRSLLQEMSEEWQRKYVAMMGELMTEFPGYGDISYEVERVRDDWANHSPCATEERLEMEGRVEVPTMEDPLSAYRHPDRGYIDSLRKTEPPETAP